MTAVKVPRNITCDMVYQSSDGKWSSFQIKTPYSGQLQIISLWFWKKITAIGWLPAWKF